MRLGNRLEVVTADGYTHVFDLAGMMARSTGQILGLMDDLQAERDSGAKRANSPVTLTALDLWSRHCLEVRGYECDEGDDPRATVPIPHRLQAAILACNAALGVTATADPQRS